MNNQKLDSQKIRKFLDKLVGFGDTRLIMKLGFAQVILYVLFVMKSCISVISVMTIMMILW